MARGWNVEDPWIPSVYVVAWPDGVWKVGYSGTRERWGKFIRSGARLVDLVEFWTERDARTYEKTLRQGFLTFSSPAFTHSDQARRHMRDTYAAGWTECVRIPDEVWARFTRGAAEAIEEGRAEQCKWEMGGNPVLEFARMLILLAAWNAVDGGHGAAEHPPGHVPWQRRPKYARAAELPVAKPEMWAVA